MEYNNNMQKKSKQQEYRISAHRNYNKQVQAPTKKVRPTKQEVINTILKVSHPNTSEQVDHEAWKVKEEKLINDLQNSFQIEYFDKNLDANPLVGNNAVNSFYKHYKNLDRIKDQNSYENIKPSVYTSMLSRCENLGILPSKLGIVKYKGDAGKVHIPYSRYGQKYLEALSEGLKEMSVTACNFNSTRFGQCSAESIPFLSRGLQSLKLQSNSLDSRSMSSLHRLFQDGSRLMELDLANNKLTDNGVLILCQNLQNNTRIRILNLSQNSLTCRCTSTLAELLRNNNLQQVYLQWNKIQSEGGRYIFEGVNNSQSVKILNMGWNLLGNNQGCLEQLQKLLRQNTQLYHLDLSNNSFTRDQCATISQSLEFNRSLYGFHFDGNYGYVDCRGFLHVDKTQGKQLAYNSTPSGLSLTQPSFSRLKKSTNKTIRNVCWLCQGWIQHEFVLELPNETQKDVWIHLGFDGFRGYHLGKTARKTLSYVCMIPVTQFEFFWMVDQQQTTSTRYPLVVHKDNYKLKGVSFGTDVKDINVDKRNCYQTPNKGPPLQLLPCTVRPRDTIHEDDLVENRNQSQICTETKQTQEQLKQRFQSQWQILDACQVISQQDTGECRQIFEHNYPTIRQIYRYYSCLSQTYSNQMLLDGHSLKAMFTDHQMIEGQFTEQKLAESLLELRSQGGCGQNQTSKITRPRFMQMLCLVVGIKFQGSTFVQGLKTLMEILQMNKSLYEIHERWRDRVLLIEGLHKQTKKYNKRFETLFHSIIKHSPNKQSVQILSVLKLLSKKVLCGKQIGGLQLKRACYYSQHKEDVVTNGQINVRLDYGQFVQVFQRLAFTDDNGDMIEENSPANRRDRLQKVIDFMPASAE